MTNSDSEIRVLITGAGGAGSLGRELMKSFQLASQKYKIVATNSSPTSIGLFETSFGYVIPKASSPQYLNTLLKICKKEKIQAVVGGSEPEIKIIAKNMKVFSENGIEVLSNTIDIIELCSDKYKLANFLSAKNLSPKTVLFKNNEVAPHGVKEITSGTRYAIRKFYYQSNSIPIEDPHQSLYWYDGEKAYNPQKKMPTNS